MRFILMYFVFMIGFSTSAQDCNINVYEALKYKGKEMTVCGIVTQIYTPEYVEGKPVYINMGGNFPNHSFTIAIWGDDVLKFNKGLQKFKNKHIAITGVIREYKGKAQIILKNPNQIRIIK